MLKELAPFSPTPPTGTTVSVKPEVRPSAGSAAPGAAVANVRRQDATPQLAVEPAQALDRAAKAAARAVFHERDVEVTSFHDEGTGRVVYRVADRKSGEVLLQTPPDALLRFFASAREALAEPLLAMSA